MTFATRVFPCSSCGAPPDWDFPRFVDNSLKWQPIETAPKYPLGGLGYSGPHFIALDPEWGAVEAWFEYPHPGSIAYAENHPPKIQFVAPRAQIGWVTLKPTHWMPLPPKPEQPSKDSEGA